jgi:hypothetical protein
LAEGVYALGAKRFEELGSCELGGLGARVRVATGCHRGRGEGSDDMQKSSPVDPGTRKSRLQGATHHVGWWVNTIRNHLNADSSTRCARSE